MPHQHSDALWTCHRAILTERAASIVRKASAHTIVPKGETEIIMRSGLRSRFFVNLSATYRYGGLLTPASITELSVYLTLILIHEHERLISDGNVIFGVPSGGNPFAAGIEKLLSAHVRPYEMRYLYKRGHDKKGLSPIYTIGDERAIVIEDVLTTGTSTERVLLHLKRHSIEPILVATIYNREQGGTDLITKEYGLPLVSLLTHNNYLKHLHLAGEITYGDMLSLAT